MDISLNPFSSFYWGERAPPIKSARDIHRLLDVNRTAKRLDCTPSIICTALTGPFFVQACLRNAIFILITPIRLALIILVALGQLLRECPRNGLLEQPRVVFRIFYVTFLHLSFALASPIQPLLAFFPMARSLNLIDLRAASLFTQSSIPVRSLSGLFGHFFPNAALHSDLDFAPHTQASTGRCLGESLWALALFTHCEKKCPDTAERFRAATSQFCQGAPVPAALLQDLAYSIGAPGPLSVGGWLNELCFLLKPSALQSVMRGTWRHIQEKIGDFDSKSSLFTQIATCYQQAREVRDDLGQHARWATLANLTISSARHIVRRPAKGLFSAISRSSCNGFQEIASLSDGDYLMISSNPGAVRHATVYVKRGDAGYLFDPNAGNERHLGPDHWRAVADVAARCNHEQLTFLKVAKRGLCDLGPLELRRRFAELSC